MDIKFKKIITCAIFLSSFAHAGPVDYQCTIKGAYESSDTGVLDKVNNSQAVGKVFLVNRKTGDVITPIEISWPMKGSLPTIISQGDEDNAFKVTYSSVAKNGGVHFQFLQIREFESSLEKKFIVVSGGRVETGTCK